MPSSVISSSLLQGILQMLRAAALGLAAAAIAIQTARWLIAKRTVDGKDKSPLLSPKASEVEDWSNEVCPRCRQQCQAISAHSLQTYLEDKATLS